MIPGISTRIQLQMITENFHVSVNLGCYTHSQRQNVFISALFCITSIFFVINVLASSNKKKDYTSGFRKAAC